MPVINTDGTKVSIEEISSVTKSARDAVVKAHKAWFDRYASERGLGKLEAKTEWNQCAAGMHAHVKTSADRK